MKIHIFDRALEIMTNKLNLQKPNTEEEIVSSYCVDFKEAFSNTTYYYLRTKDGKEALYLYPGYKFISGTNFLNRKTLETLPKKHYKSRQELTREEITERYFYHLFSEYKQDRYNQLSGHKYKKAFDYLTSLYYGENKEYLDAYNELYSVLKRNCDNLGIVYETDPEKILEQKLQTAYDEEEFKTIDLRICKSKESIDRYYIDHVLSQTDSRKFSHNLTDLQYLKSDFTMSYNGEFLSHSENLIKALTESNYPNREEILKNYMEFFISKDLAFSLSNYLTTLVSQGDKVLYEMEQERYNNNIEFMENLTKMIEHDREKETYRYHATTSLEDAKRILEEGFYMYSQDLGSTSFAEFNVKQILSYSYGNGIEQFGDYIIVLSEPKNEDIVEELSEEEQEQVTIIPRRNAIIGNKPEYKVDKKHVVGIVDKKHERVILNPEYINNEKKQINM